jgi:hypothetical protein
VSVRRLTGKKVLASTPQQLGRREQRVVIIPVALTSEQSADARATNGVTIYGIEQAPR